MTIYTALDDKINILSDRIIDYARELLKRPSLSGRELEAQQYVLEVVKNLKADIKISGNRIMTNLKIIRPLFPTAPILAAALTWPPPGKEPAKDAV